MGFLETYVETSPQRRRQASGYAPRFPSTSPDIDMNQSLSIKISSCSPVPVPCSTTTTPLWPCSRRPRKWLNSMLGRAAAEAQSAAASAASCQSASAAAGRGMPRPVLLAMPLPPMLCWQVTAFSAKILRRQFLSFFHFSVFFSLYPE